MTEQVQKLQYVVRCLQNLTKKRMECFTTVHPILQLWILPLYYGYKCSIV